MQENCELERATRDGAISVDEKLKKLNRSKILGLPRFERLRWFYLIQLSHVELQRVISDVLELLEGDANTRIVALVGMTAAGKSTAIRAIANALIRKYRSEMASSSADIPVLVMNAPANGEKSLSWAVIYTRALQSGGAGVRRQLKGTSTTDDRIEYSSGPLSVAQLREFLEDLIKARGTRVLVIDEAYHLLRFGAAGHTAVMDTLKSISEITGLKLLLVGNYDLAEAVVSYPQVARRAEIVHFNSYIDPSNVRANQRVELRPPPKKPKSGESTDHYAFYSAVAKYQEHWPCETVPNLCAMWWPLMVASAGSIGLLKMALARLAYLQMMSPSETLTHEMFKKMAKPLKALNKIYHDLQVGSEMVKYVTYGSATSCALNQDQFLEVIGGQNVQ